MKLFSPDDEIYVYADSMEQAKEAFKEELGYECDDSDWEEHPLYTVVYSYEMIGLGGYATVEFADFLKSEKYETPMVFTDFKDIYENTYLKYVD